MKKEYARYLVNKTKQDYNKIAQEFSSSRAFLWSDLTPFLEYSTAGDKVYSGQSPDGPTAAKPPYRVLDLGCGNGRLYQALENKNVDYIGVDNSEKLIEIAQKKYPKAKFQVADGLNLPFLNNSFDKIYCIAVLHHIPSQDLRLKFLQEAKRVLKPNGLLILTVWKLGQIFSMKLVLKYTVLKLIGKSKLDFGDVLVPWGKKCKRYVHNFSEKGLADSVKEAGFEMEKIGTLWRPEKKNANIYAVARK